ncbi:formylglycine-generating enzyme family protein [Microcoleus sp. Aus8_D2]|uniref:formylglycine-generating enzyme family protein n=1 Tax=unclassified Microcoleus TaxID=2642155 RepID=UPI003FA5C4BF
MNNKNNNEKLIVRKKQYLELLYKQFDSAYTQLETTVNEFDKPSIQAKIKVLENQIEQVHKEIDNLELRSSQTGNDSHPQSGNFIEKLGNGVQLEMLHIPQGSFLMGSPENELERSNDEGPPHPVTVPAFFMGKYPVTQAQWKIVANLPQVNRELNPDPSCFKGVNRPVETVSWYDAVEFCARLSLETGKTYRLPSEAEWEYACRAGTNTPFHFGETITTDLANYNGNYTYAAGSKGIYREQTMPVGSFGVANAFGLYDMHGNVWEWCADPWHDSYDGAPGDGRVWDETCNDNRYQNSIDLLVHTEAKDNRTRLLRGGSWLVYPRNCRSAIRLNHAPDIVNFLNGFRVVCVAAWT